MENNLGLNYKKTKHLFQFYQHLNAFFSLENYQL